MGSGNDMILGSMLGQLIGLHQQLVSLHHDANEHLSAIEQSLLMLPGRIAESVPKSEPASPAGVMGFMKMTKELIQSLIPLGLLALLVMGKATWSDVLPIIRSMLGVH